MVGRDIFFGDTVLFSFWFCSSESLSEMVSSICFVCVCACDTKESGTPRRGWSCEERFGWLA